MNQMAVWMDNHEARIFHVDAQNFDEKTVEKAHGHVHRHPKDDETSHGGDEHRFFRDIAHLLEAADRILVLGPSVTKAQFAKYVTQHHQAVAAKIVAVENADHPTDRQIVAHVRHHFHIDSPRHTSGG